MRYDIPGRESLDIQTIILDLNGTLSVGGTVPTGVKQRLKTLSELGFNLTLFTGNTRNDADELCSDLGISWQLARNSEDKRNMALELGAENCATIGNGLIDLELMKVVKLGIVTLQSEGVHVQTMLSADIVVPNINDALDLFIDSQRLIATLRT